MQVGWSNTDILGTSTTILKIPTMDFSLTLSYSLGPIRAASPPGVPFEFDTDVNAPCMAEFTLGGLRQKGHTSCAYITVGTGIGVGLVVNGQCVHGLVHPEAII